MATVPRAQKSQPTASTLFTRPQSEFDAGLNTSAAWTEHLERESLSDGEPDLLDVKEDVRPARALYDFEGKMEFHELIVAAGDELEVIKEELADGWSLVKNETGEMGLIPRSYYAFTSDFAVAPGLELSSTNGVQSSRKPSEGDATPRSTSPIVPQNTGEWFALPSFRHRLLGGKSLNRFSSFVASGAEEWILKGSAADVIVTSPTHEKLASDVSELAEEDASRQKKSGMGEADCHFVDIGPSWKSKLPGFRVMVHSPSKRTSKLSGAYIVYAVTSLFHLRSLTDPNEDAETTADEDTPVPSSTRVTVYRRFSHFVILHAALTRRLPGIALPPLPEKQYAGRFSEEFVEARRGDLERYINRVVRHPIARYAEVMTFFLGCESDAEWDRLLPMQLDLPPAGPSFYSRVFHPAFNLDAEEAEEVVERFTAHTHAVGKGVQGLRSIFGQVRQARIEMSKAERLLSYSLLSLITGKPLASAPVNGVDEDDDSLTNKGNGVVNSDGAWCWRQECQDCLRLTKAIQKMSEMLQSTADLYDDHARRTQLATHDALKSVAHPSSVYNPVVDTHKSTLSRYKEATEKGRSDEDMAARCETVLNTTMAEMETYHSQKLEDFRMLASEHLDGEIEFYEQILSRLRIARLRFDTLQWESEPDTPRQPSIYERELENPRLSADPLPQPCLHVFDSAPMRPVSIALQEGVGMLFGASPTSPGGVLSKFW